MLQHSKGDLLFHSLKVCRLAGIPLTRVDSVTAQRMSQGRSWFSHHVTSSWNSSQLSLPSHNCLSGYSIVSLQWSPVVSLAAPPLTSATSAAQCQFWMHVGCCVLLRRVSFWSLVPVWLLCSEGPFRLWVHQHGMISPLSCVPC